MRPKNRYKIQVAACNAIQASSFSSEVVQSHNSTRILVSMNSNSTGSASQLICYY